MRYFKKFLKLAGFTQSNLTGQGKERLVLGKGNAGNQMQGLPECSY